ERASSDDRVPLNPKNPSVRSGSITGGAHQGIGVAVAEDTMARSAVPYMGPGRGLSPGPRRGPPLDQYGNPLPPGAGYGQGDMQPPMLRHQGSDDPVARLRFTAADVVECHPEEGTDQEVDLGREADPKEGMEGEDPTECVVDLGIRGPPPPGWNASPRGMSPSGMAMGAGAGMATGAMMGRGQRGPPPGYDNDYHNGPRQQAAELPSPTSPDFDARDAPPGGPLPPMPDDGLVGQAIEMDARTGTGNSATPPYGTRGNDGDLPSPAGLPPGVLRERSPLRQGSNPSSPTHAMNPSIMYPTE
ncbi:hypothetical protein LTR04_004434, partial [Oleoguttula sp. CCFEE 6159]